MESAIVERGVSDYFTCKWNLLTLPNFASKDIEYSAAAQGHGCG